MVHLYLCLPAGADRKYIREKKNDIYFQSNFTLSVFFTLMYFLSAPVRQTFSFCPILHCLSPLLLCIFYPHWSGRQRYKCTTKVVSYLCILRVLYWYILLLNKQDLREWTNQLLWMNLSARSRRGIKATLKFKADWSPI